MRASRSTALLLGLVLTTAAGCSTGDWNRGRYDDGWNDDGNDGWQNTDDDCRRGRGRVNMKKWQARVDSFRAKDFNKKKNFQNAKQNLLSELAGERDKACNWEKGQVDLMMSEVRSRTW